MKFEIPAAAATAILAIICAAGAVYSALANGVMVANGATFGTILFTVATVLLWDYRYWNSAEEKEQFKKEQAPWL